MINNNEIDREQLIKEAVALVMNSTDEDIKAALLAAFKTGGCNEH